MWLPDFYAKSASADTGALLEDPLETSIHENSTTDVGSDATGLFDDGASATHSLAFGEPLDDLPDFPPTKPLDDAALPQRMLTVLDGGKSDALPAVALDTLRHVDVTQLDDEHVALFRELVLESRREVSGDYGKLIDRCDAELIARIKKAGGRAIPSFEFEKIELVEEYTPYAFDDVKLREAMAKLSPADAKKIGEVIPARTVFVPEHFVRSKTAAVSATALIERYGPDHPIGKMLSAAMTRTKVDEKLVVKRAKPDRRTIEAL